MKRILVLIMVVGFATTGCGIYFPSGDGETRWFGFEPASKRYVEVPSSVKNPKVVERNSTTSVPVVAPAPAPVAAASAPCNNSGNVVVVIVPQANGPRPPLQRTRDGRPIPPPRAYYPMQSPRPHMSPEEYRYRREMYERQLAAANPSPYYYGQ